MERLFWGLEGLLGVFERHFLTFSLLQGLIGGGVVVVGHENALVGPIHIHILSSRGLLSSNQHSTLSPKWTARDIHNKSLHPSQSACYAPTSSASHHSNPFQFSPQDPDTATSSGVSTPSFPTSGIPYRPRHMRIILPILLLSHPSPLPQLLHTLPRTPRQRPNQLRIPQRTK